MSGLNEKYPLSHVIDLIFNRFINVDYIFCSAVHHFPNVPLYILYDIVCQWALHAQERIDTFPAHLRVKLPDISDLRYAIPKLHWHGHKRDGHSWFSLNLNPYSFRTDGEGNERRWWDIQPIVASIKMMGPGARQGSLNDQWNYTNHRKVVQIGV